jgi:hypothetical protein
MCRTAPNQLDKNPCENLCPEINEGLTKIINFAAGSRDKARTKATGHDSNTICGIE